MIKMALKTVTTFPIFAPPNPNHHRPATELRFSRWNNANAEKFIRHERTQKDIEDELRILRRFNSAQKIANIHDNATTSTTDTFRSTGTPSTPSRPSIPGKSSKYSKNPKNPQNPGDSHPAFRRISIRKVPNKPQKTETDVKIGDKGVSYVIPNAPFEFQYSYTETPKEKPLKLREPPIAPFEPGTMPRPWTGRKPLPPSKKKNFEFDSFQLPPPNKKRVKPVQSPGPFLPGSGPKYVRSREEILGEPLTKEEIEDLINGCMKAKRQLNMGRDGLTHNMLDNIHALWKRRRVCKIKCKGVCTVDMDNVRQQLEERTGGKIIYSRGGVIYLFRGRNYNDKTRPRFPLMLWKPITPVYPRLIQQAPEGLTLEEASEMRKKGRILTPICKLGKNGVYYDLVKNVREAFEACELVRINCQGMNGSDYRKIGAKLKDLVPCVLISFEHEHLLMWRGRDWKSSLPLPKNEIKDIKKSEGEAKFKGETKIASSVPNSSVEDTILVKLSTSTFSSGTEDIGIEEGKDVTLYEVQNNISEANDMLSLATHDSTTTNINGSESEKPFDSERETNFESEGLDEDESSDVSDNFESLGDPARLSSPWTEEVLLLRKQAVESGSALVLDVSCLDADIVYDRAVALAQTAPPGPVFRHWSRKLADQKCEKQDTGDGKFEKKETGDEKIERQEGGDLEVKEAITIPENRGNKRKSSRNQKMKDLAEDYLIVAPKGSLRVDELAKLLA